MRKGERERAWRLVAAVVALSCLIVANEARADELNCESIDVVFLVDTSGSIQDEGAVLCANINQIVTDLTVVIPFIDTTILGIVQNPPGSYFACLTDNVPNVYGTTVPGIPPACCPTLNKNEDWAAATAIVAENRTWLVGALRVIIPISDEGPEDGDPCDDPGVDRASITNAINVAIANDVIVAPIMGNGSSACTIGLAADLAAGTGGESFASTDPASDLVTAIQTILTNLCQTVPPPPPGPLDFCPADPAKVDPGACGCGVPDADVDGDVVADCIDNCVGTENTDQADLDGDGIGDACDPSVDLPLQEYGCAPGACGAGVGVFLVLGLWSLCGAKLARRRGRPA
jgi:hypothetical protein